MIDIQLEHITKVFGGGSAAVRAVDDVSLRIAGGELFFLLGPSGCGKTTLLRILAGLTAPDAGRIRFAGRDVTDLAVEKRNTALVFQSYALWPHMTVERNVMFGPKMRGVGRQRRRELARENLQRVQMDDLAGRKPNQLSGGQQQRVAVARALAAEPACLLLDEPLSNLDARLRLHMRGELRRLVKASGTTAVYVTHDQTEALSMADRVAVMHAGRIVQVADPQTLYDRPGTRFVADFLGEANFISGTVRAGAAAHDSDAAGPAEETVIVETPLGPLRAAATDAPADGEQVVCCVRPERVGIAAAEQGAEPAPGALRGTVEQSTFLGGLRQYVCRVRQQTWRVSVLADRGAGLPPGTPVRLTIGPADVTLLRK